jgi:5'-nucleotidase
MKKILLTNDDGIDSPGLWILEKKLRDLGETVVVAPQTEKSGIGKAVSTGTVEVIETHLKSGTKAYAVTGTPADAVLLALFKILEETPDIVVSGINLGPNIGIDDLLTSGTLGAAFEAAIHGVPSVATSYCIERIGEGSPKKKVTVTELEFAANLTQEVVEYVLRFGMPPKASILNINVPAGTAMKRVGFTKLSYKGYLDIFRKHERGYRIYDWVLDDYPDDYERTDIYVIKRGKQVSITPIKLDFVPDLNSLSKLADFLEQRGYAVK